MVIVIAYSAYDYFEHIGRSGSTFEEHPWHWLLFNLLAIFSFMLVVGLLKKLFERIFNQKNLVIEVAAIGIWMMFYIALLGPVIDALAWPFGELNFRFKFGPIFIILIGYFIIRLVINLIVGKNALYSK